MFRSILGPTILTNSVTPPVRVCALKPQSDRCGLTLEFRCGTKSEVHNFLSVLVRHFSMKKGIKYDVVFPGFFILGIIFLVLVTLLLIQTEPAKRKIARVAETEVNKLLNGNLSIGKIEGNFFTGLSLQNVLLTLENDTLAQIEEIKASYNLWPLLRNTLDIYSAEIIR